MNSSISVWCMCLFYGTVWYFRSNMIKAKVVAASSSLRMEQAACRNRDRDTNWHQAATHSEAIWELGSAYCWTIEGNHLRGNFDYIWLTLIKVSNWAQYAKRQKAYINCLFFSESSIYVTASELQQRANLTPLLHGDRLLQRRETVVQAGCKNC